MGRIRRRTGRRLAFLVFVVAFALLANFFGPELFWRVRALDAAVCRAFMAGAVVAEVGLLSIWAALGPQPVVYRQPLALFFLVLTSCSLLMGMQRSAGIISLEDAFVLGLVGMVVFSAVQLPLLIARARDHKRIASPDTRYLAPEEESLRFSMRYLLGWTAAVCFLLVVVRHSLPGAGFDRSIMAELPAILAVWLLLAALSALICLPCVRLAMTNNLSGRSLAWLVVVHLLGPPGITAAVGLIHGWPAGTDELLLGLYSFTFGLALTTLGVLYGLRMLGFRLVSDERAWQTQWGPAK